MTYVGGSPPLAMVGTGYGMVAALINRFVDIAYNASDRLEEPVHVAIIDTREEPPPVKTQAYPLQGRPVRQLHPFTTVKPPEHFPTFGEYFEELLEEGVADLSRDVLESPTWDHMREYLEYMLELAVTAAGGKLLVIQGPKVPIESISETTPGGFATIWFTDGTSLDARYIVKPKRPPYLAGPWPDLPPIPDLAREVRTALAGGDLTFTVEGGGSYFVFAGPGRTAVMPHEGDEASLGARVQSLLPTLKQHGLGEVWIVTWDSVGEILRSTFQDQPVRFFSLTEFRAMMELMLKVGHGAMFRE